MYFLHLPLLIILCMRIGSEHQPLAEMTDDRVLLVKFRLFVINSRNQLLPRCRLEDRRLIRKKELLRTYQCPCLDEQTGPPYHLHIQEQHSCIEIIRTDQPAAIFLFHRRVFIARHINLPQLPYVVRYHNINVQIQQLIRYLRNSVRKQPEQCIRRTVRCLIDTAAEFLPVQLCHIELFHPVIRILLLDHMIQECDLFLCDRREVRPQSGQLHRHNIDMDRLLCPVRHGDQLRQCSVKYLFVAAKQDINHISPVFPSCCGNAVPQPDSFLSVTGGLYHIALQIERVYFHSTNTHYMVFITMSSSSNIFHEKKRRTAYPVRLSALSLFTFLLPLTSCPFRRLRLRALQEFPL